MDWQHVTSGISLLFGASGLTGGLRLWWKSRERDRRGKQRTPYSEDVLRHSRLIWRDYAYLLKASLRITGVNEIPPDPADPFEELLHERERHLIQPPAD